MNKEGLKILVLISIILLFNAGCVFSEVRMNKISKKKTQNSENKIQIALGYIKAVSPRSSDMKSEILSNAILFQLQKFGFEVYENKSWSALLKKLHLPENRLLDDNELFGMSEQFPGQYILQGNYYEFLKDDGYEERYAILLDCFLSDASTGKKVAYVKIFQSNMKVVSGKELNSIAKKLAQKIKNQQ